MMLASFWRWNGWRGCGEYHSRFYGTKPDVWSDDRGWLARTEFETAGIVVPYYSPAT